MAIPEYIRKVPRPHCKSDECLDKTDAQGDFSLIGSWSINFISTVLTCRMLRKAREAEEKSSGR